ncbi:MAG: hypothetical protein ACFCVG_03300 [Kineosporiaceae bacterium]
MTPFRARTAPAVLIAAAVVLTTAGCQPPSGLPSASPSASPAPSLAPSEQPSAPPTESVAPSASPSPSAPLASPTPGDAASSDAPSGEAALVDLLVDDMTLPHEGRPHGVPEESGWATGPRIGMGNDPGTWLATTAWGQAYEEAEGNPAVNSAVTISALTLLVLREDGTWEVLQDTDAVTGAYYVEDFVDDVSKSGDQQVAPDGSVSVVPGDGFNYHFWPPERAEIGAGGIAGLVVAARARLTLLDPEGVDDRGEARLLLGVGGDYWEDLDAEWDNFRTNGDFAIGRFRYVTAEDQLFTATTMTAEQLEANPPPLDLLP